MSYTKIKYEDAVELPCPNCKTITEIYDMGAWYGHCQCPKCGQGFRYELNTTVNFSKAIALKQFKKDINAKVALEPWVKK